MRKILFSMLFLGMALYICGNASAAGVGNPITQLGEWEFSVGVEDTYVFGRDLEGAGDMTGGEIEESHQIYAKGTLGVSDYLNLYLKMGAANLEEKLNWNTGRSQTLDFDFGLLLGGGIAWIYDFGDDWGVALDNQVLWWNVDVDSISGDNSPSLSQKGSVDNVEFQSTLLLKYTTYLGDSFLGTPYAGGFYSYYEVSLDESISFTDDTYSYTHGDAEGEDNFGVVVGLDCSFPQYENLVLNVEGRFIAESAITAGMRYKF